MAESQCPILNTEYMQVRVRYLEAKIKLLEVSTKHIEAQGALALNMQPAIAAVTKMFETFTTQLEEQRAADIKRQADFEKSLRCAPVTTMSEDDIATCTFTPGCIRAVPRTTKRNNDNVASEPSSDVQQGLVALPREVNVDAAIVDDQSSDSLIHDLRFPVRVMDGECGPKGL